MKEEMHAIPVSDGRRYYAFIDNARFLAMLAIVMRHCEGNLLGDSPLSALQSAIVQASTFRVQLFFLISGFLMRDWLTRNNFNYRAFWRNRITRVGMPWLMWAAVYVLLTLLQSWIRPHGPAISVGETVIRDLFFSTYWFVPVLFVSLVIMLALRGAWESWSLGLAFLCLSLFYGVNQYFEWLPSGHTIAVFGYLFFVWVGIRLNEEFETVSAWVQRVSWWKIAVLLGSTYALALFEDWYMNSLGFPDTYNALQLSNQLYSFVVLVALIRTSVAFAPSFVDVRHDTFGIYLTHVVVAQIGRAAVNTIAGRNSSGETLFTQFPMLVQNPFIQVFWWIAWTAAVYVGALLLTKWLRRVGLAWTVGTVPATTEVARTGGIS